MYLYQYWYKCLSACVDVRYIPKDVGVALDFTLNGDVIFSEEVSGMYTEYTCVPSITTSSIHHSQYLYNDCGLPSNCSWSWPQGAPLNTLPKYHSCICILMVCFLLLHVSGIKSH